MVGYAKGFAKYDLIHGQWRSRDGTSKVTLRDAMTAGGQASKIPNYEPEYQYKYLVDAFWELKCGDIEHRIHHSDMQHVLLNRIDKGIIFAMDAAFMKAVSKEQAEALKQKDRNGK